MTAMQMNAMRTARLRLLQSHTNRAVATLMYRIRGMDVRDAKSMPWRPHKQSAYRSHQEDIEQRVAFDPSPHEGDEDTYLKEQQQSDVSRDL